MEMSLSRKVLNIAAFIDYINAALAMLLCVLAIAGGYMGLTNSELADSIPVTFGAATMIGLGAILGIEALMSFITALLSRRAVKDPSKIMPVWVISLISLILTAGDTVINCMNNTPITEMRSDICSLAISILIFVVACNIKKEAGK